MKPLRTLLLSIGLLMLVGTGTAQSGKAFFKDAESLRAENQLDQALEKYGLAIQVDPKYLKAYEARADVYELLGRKQESAADRRKVADLEPAEPKPHVRVQEDGPQPEQDRRAREEGQRKAQERQHQELHQARQGLVERVHPE